jgi:exodeoxyribonuclease V alpha subunit
MVRDGIASLTVNHRFDAASAIGALADAVRAGRADDAVDVLRSGAAGVEHVVAPDDAPLGAETLAAVQRDVVAWGTALRTAGLAGDHGRALRALDGHRLLCAHRRGPRGVQLWEQLALRWLVAADPDLLAVRADGHHPGEPLLVTSNDYEVGLFNGDTGVVVDVGGALQSAFERRGEIVLVSPTRLSAVETLYAMTIHKSQGSQFGEVVVVLPDESSPILTRELLYTAVTRAELAVRVVGTEGAVRAAVTRPVSRASGLRERLWG